VSSGTANRRYLESIGVSISTWADRTVAIGGN